MHCTMCYLNVLLSKHRIGQGAHFSLWNARPMTRSKFAMDKQGHCWPKDKIMSCDSLSDNICDVSALRQICLTLLTWRRASVRLVINCRDFGLLSSPSCPDRPEAKTRLFRICEKWNKVSFSSCKLRSPWTHSWYKSGLIRAKRRDNRSSVSVSWETSKLMRVVMDAMAGLKRGLGSTVDR